MEQDAAGTGSTWGLEEEASRRALLCGWPLERARGTLVGRFDLDPQGQQWVLCETADGLAWGRFLRWDREGETAVVRLPETVGVYDAARLRTISEVESLQRSSGLHWDVDLPREMPQDSRPVDASPARSRVLGGIGERALSE